MASSSSSSIKNIFNYDVFLSFRGEDTRKNFVDHLYFALEQRSINTYKDNEKMKKGKKISSELIKSIENSKFYIIVFSKDYASSSWCLDELVKIMECHRTTDHTAYPLFYDVEPTEVCKQIGAVGEAFARHENEETAGKWREALKEAADLAGWELKNTADGHEAKFIQKIVEEISLELRSINFSVDGKLIGMETRVKDLVSSLEMGTDDVRIIGIRGMGGGGKTTLARAVFDYISIWFEGKSFVENVREVSKASFNGLKKLQKQVLSDVLNNQGIAVGSVHDGKNMMKRMMSGKKVLVVLDDVDHLDQLEALAGESNWFRRGSRIIITTRDEQVLLAHRVNLIRDVTLLSHEEAICLFSRYAFGREFPIQGYEDLSGKVIRYADGLPITIRVLGSFLCGKHELEWMDAIERLKTIPLKETLGKLELSYINLEDDYKEIFLDVACMLKGYLKDDAIKVLECCGFHARNGLRVLEQKSLITISDAGYLGMHDHMEEMGRNIVRRSHPDESNRHSRLWIDEEITYILANDLGTEATRCIKPRMMRLDLESVMRSLGNMRKLRVLYMQFEFYLEFNEVKQHFPHALRYLSWQGYPFRSLLETFQADNLVGLDMSFSKIKQLWEGGEKKVLNQLRFLDLNNSKLTTFDLGMTPNIEILNLATCFYLVEFHVPVRCPKLKFLSLKNSKLTILDLGLIPNLETLSLAGCHNLVKLNMPFVCPKLKSLKLSNSKLRTLDLGLIPNLEKLKFAGCHNLVELHMPAGSLKLKFLHLGHSKLRTVDLGLTPNLEKLDLQYCYELEKIHAPLGCLRKLVYLDLTACWRFKSFLFDKRSKSLEVESVSELHLIGESMEICPLHYHNTLPKFRFTCFYKEHLSSSMGNLEKLISIGLCACTNIETFSRSICSLQRLRKLTLNGSIPEVPKDLDQLERLEELVLSNTKIKHLPDSICMLKYLKSLQLKSCLLLEKLPKDLGQLESLEKLILTSCEILQIIPISICKMKRLKIFHLCNSFGVEKLPEELGCVESLKELNIEGTSISHLPQGIFRLKGLRIVGSICLLQSCGFTSDQIQTSQCETFCYISFIE